jgi:hypothetical protein
LQKETSSTGGSSAAIKGRIFASKMPMEKRRSPQSANTLPFPIGTFRKAMGRQHETTERCQCEDALRLLFGHVGASSGHLRSVTTQRRRPVEPAVNSGHSRPVTACPLSCPLSRQERTLWLGTVGQVKRGLEREPQISFGFANQRLWNFDVRSCLNS